ncbi:STAS domain-containing protein [Streptomyces sp. NPDC127036]|uniref:STAS domain-containing protein n=1 Tax=unclassified Streptomyces TaxID=2593676 RepID=UPI003648E516
MGQGDDVDSRMDLSVAGASGRTIVRVAGEVDYLTSPRLADELEDVLAAGAGWVDVEFTDVSFCDCAALGVLIRARQKAQAAGARLRLRGSFQPSVSRLLAVMELTSVLTAPSSR